MFNCPPALGLALLLGLSPSLPGQEATTFRNEGDAVWYLVPGDGITSATFSTGPDRASQLDAPGVAWAPQERIPVPPHHVVKLVTGHLGSARIAIQVLDCFGRNPAGLSLTSEWWQALTEGEPVRINDLQTAHPEYPMATTWAAALGTWTAPNHFTFSLDHFPVEPAGLASPPPSGQPTRPPVPESPPAPAAAAHAQPQAGAGPGALDPEPPAAAAGYEALEPVIAGPLRIDPRRGKVTLNGWSGHLTPRLANLLAVLARRPGEVVSYQDLLGLPQGSDRDAQLRLKDLSFNLRRRLGELFDLDPRQLLVNVPGRGYRLQVEALEPVPEHPARLPVPEPVQAAAAAASYAQAPAASGPRALDPEPPVAAPGNETLEPVLAGPLRIDPRSGQVTLNGRGGHLTPRLVDLLAVLARRPGEVVSAQELLGLPQAPDPAAQHRLQEQISVLRSHLGEQFGLDPQRLLVTVFGRGYQLRVEALATPSGASQEPVTEHPARLPVPEPASAAAAGDESLEPVLAGPLRIEPRSGQVTLNGRNGHLAPRLAYLLAILARHPGDVVSAQELLGLPQAPDRQAQERLRGQVTKLRMRLGELFDLDSRRGTLVNVPGRGYQLQVAALGLGADGPATGEDGPPTPKRPRLNPQAAASAASAPTVHPGVEATVTAAGAPQRLPQPSGLPRVAPPALTLGNHTPWWLVLAMSELDGSGRLTLANPGHPVLASQLLPPGSGPYLLLPGAVVSLNVPASTGTFRAKFTLHDPSDPSRLAGFAWSCQPGPGLVLTSPATGLSLATEGSRSVSILPGPNP